MSGAGVVDGFRGRLVIPLLFVALLMVADIDDIVDMVAVDAVVIIDEAEIDFVGVSDCNAVMVPDQMSTLSLGSITPHTLPGIVSNGSLGMIEN
jgi:hypothetical protein